MSPAMKAPQVPRAGAPHFMFRVANGRESQIVEAKLRVVMLRNEVTQEGERMRRMHDLQLVRGESLVFPLSWSAFHKITPESPLHGATPESLAAGECEVLVAFTGVDETFAQNVHALHSYTPEEIRWNARFVDVVSRLDDGRRAVNYEHFHEVVPVDAAK